MANKHYEKLNLGDTVYVITEDRTSGSPVCMECVVEDILGGDMYDVFDVTQNRMYTKHISDMVTQSNMEYSISEWMKIKVKRV